MKNLSFQLLKSKIPSITWRRQRQFTYKLASKLWRSRYPNKEGESIGESWASVVGWQRWEDDNLGRGESWEREVRVERVEREVWESGRKKNINNNILIGCGNKKLIVSLAFSYNAQPYIAVHCNYIDKNFTNTTTNIATLLYMVKIAF